jgi:hypothetical protein
MTAHDFASFDNDVRLAVYARFIKDRRAPTRAEIASHLSCSEAEIRDSFQRLADAHVLVLQPGSREILMANPLSAVPTPFPVESSRGEFWGNCIWDALGIIAMLGGSGRVKTSCGCCGEAMMVEVRENLLLAVGGVVHFAIPAAHWWDDIVFN